MHSTGIILILSWPDVYVSAIGGPYDGLFSLLGFNKGGKYKAGHSALVLIERATGLAEFFDFGRYITPLGMGRVRGASTDPEVRIPIKAQFQGGELLNLSEIFIYLDANPQYTHGEGRMLASVNQQVDYNKAREYILALQAKGSITYSPFIPSASNCSRFVADTLKKGAEDRWLRLKNAARVTITPSPLGNVLNGSPDKIFYRVFEGEIERFKAGRLFVLKDVFGGFSESAPTLSSSLLGNMEEPQRPETLAVGAQWLSGIGAGAWYLLDQTIGAGKFLIKRIAPCGRVDFCHTFSGASEFDSEEVFRFVYDCNASWCTVEQGGKRFRLEKIINV